MFFIELKTADNFYVRNFSAIGAHTFEGACGTFPTLTYPPLVDQPIIKEKHLPCVGYRSHLAGIFGKRLERFEGGHYYCKVEVIGVRVVAGN